MTAAYRKAMLALFAKRAKEFDRLHDVVRRIQAADEWRETATTAEAARAPAYLTWTGRDSNSGDGEVRKMKRVKLANSFHDTSVYILADAEMLEANENPYRVLLRRADNGSRSAKERARRIHAALCGSKDCTCGVVRG